jgi:hypothetical protein
MAQDALHLEPRLSLRQSGGNAAWCRYVLAMVVAAVLTRRQHSRPSVGVGDCSSW